MRGLAKSQTWTIHREVFREQVEVTAEPLASSQAGIFVATDGTSVISGKNPTHDSILVNY